jgi:hypothetical protein
MRGPRQPQRKTLEQDMALVVHSEWDFFPRPYNVGSTEVSLAEPAETQWRVIDDESFLNTILRNQVV